MPAAASPRLAYCTNVVPAPTPEALVATLPGTWARVRELAALPRLALGLWFPRDVAAALAGSPAELSALRDALAAHALDAVTCNAFPADAFHAPVVKEAVYLPDWTDPARAAYTRAAAEIAAALAPRGALVPVSTLPLGYPRWERARRRAAGRALAATAAELAALEERSGVRVVVALEPEPCCALERADDALRFFADELPRDAATRRHVGVCLDLCHAAVAHEDAVATLGAYAAADVLVAKVQVSAALDVADPADAAARAALATRFAEPRWLHQVGVPGRIVRDLDVALADPALAAAAPWRVHFHVPLHLASVAGVATTQPQVARFLRHVAALPAPPLLELETYTWAAVPGADDDLAAGIAAEIAWAAGELAAAAPDRCA